MITQHHTEVAINKAYDFIIAVTEKQGYLLPLNILYGDGTRFFPLTHKGFEIIYNQIKETLCQEK